MSILQFSPVKIGQAGVQPATYKMVSTDSLTAITTAGYLKQGTGGQFLLRNDLIETITSFGTVNVENTQLYVTIDTNGVITLNEDLPEGLGQAALKNVTNNALPLVTSVSGATVVGHIATFADTAGTVHDGGAIGTAATKAATNPSLPNVTSASGSFVVGELLSAADVSGTVQTSGYQIKGVPSLFVAGGSATFTVTDAFCTTSTIINLEFISQTNTSSLLTVFPDNGSFTVICNAAPGASSIMYSLLKSP
jgi:hypothetical protein